MHYFTCTLISFEQMESSFFLIEYFQVLILNHFPAKKSGSRVRWSLKSRELNTTICLSAQSLNKSNRYKSFLQSLWWLDKRTVQHCSFFVLKTECSPRLRKLPISLQKTLRFAEIFNQFLPAFYLRLIIGVMIVMTLGATVTKSPSCKFCGYFTWTSI